MRVFFFFQEFGLISYTVDGKVRWRLPLGPFNMFFSVVSAKAEWEMIAVNTLDDEVFATPVPADGELFVRTRSALYSFSTVR